MRLEFGLPIGWSLSDDLADVVKSSSPKDRHGAFGAVYLDGFDILEGGDAGGTAGMIRPYALAHNRGLAGGYARSPTLPNGVQHEGDGKSPAEKNETDTIVNMRVVPMKYNIVFWYGTTSVTELLDFFTNWAFVREHVRLNYTLAYLGFELGIQSRLSSNMTVPRKAEQYDTGGYQLYEGEIETYGYVNHDDKRDMARIPVVTELDIDLDVIEREFKTP